MQYKIVNRRNDVSLVRPNMSATEEKVKRVVDVILALIGLVFLSPFYILLTPVLALKWRGRPFFTQDRVGKGGRIFRILKFRTMSPEVETEGAQLTMEGDARLDGFSRFLRRHHLDELPQLWNVLRGDMSMVGYRPEQPCFVARIMEEDSRYEWLLSMRPGVTSEATLYNGYTDTMEKMLVRLNMDLQYMETASLRRDWLIMLKTVGIVFNDKSSK